MIAAAIVIAGVLIATSVFVAVWEPKSTTTTTSTFTKTVTTQQTTQTSAARGTVFLMNVSGSYYWADDVSRDIVIGSPGYSYFLNGSVTFDGLTFQTICPPIDQGCPGSNSSSTVVWADVVQLNIKFPGGSNETIGRAGYFEPLPTYILTINHTSPRAGILVEYVGDYNYPHSPVPYAVFLLVSSCGGAPNLC